MQEQPNTPQLDDNDPMNEPAGMVDVSFPRLVPDQIYEMDIRAPSIGASKDAEKPNTKLLTMSLETTEDATDTDGNPVYKGFKFKHRVTVASDERTKEQIKKDLALVLQACGMLDTSPAQLLHNPSIIEGKRVAVRVGLQPAKGAYPESNTARFVVPEEIKNRVKEMQKH